MPSAASTDSVPKGFAARTQEENNGTSLMRALAILELIAQKSGGLTNAEISRKMKIATSTTSYILSRLEREGYLVRTSPRGRYEMGLKVVALAHGALREMGLRRAAEPVLHRLAAETRYSALIAVLDRGLVMIVDKVEQVDLARIDMDIGVRYPAHTTALGKSMLAHKPESEVMEMFTRIHPPSNSRFVTTHAQETFLRELEQVRVKGFAVSEGELFLGVRAFASPILDATGCVRAAVSATSSTSAQTMEDSVLSGYVVRAAKQISARLADAATRKLPRQ